jgi:hypothetical protein
MIYLSYPPLYPDHQTGVGYLEINMALISKHNLKSYHSIMALN